MVSAPRVSRGQIHVIVNTTARRLRDGDGSLLGAARAACAGRAVLHATSSLEELDAVVRGLASSDRPPEVVALAGGDGTFMAGVTALDRAFGSTRVPPVALVPAGTVATVARNWGAPSDPLVALQRVLDRGAAFARRPTLRVDADEADGSTSRVGFIFGTGLVARFFELYEARGARGTAAAARMVARIFAESFVGGPFARRVLDPLPCELAVDGRVLEPKAWSLVCAAVVPDLGIHMLVTYRAAEDEQRPHVVASALPPQELGPRAPRVLAGTTIGGPGHLDQLAAELVVRFPDANGPYVLDGDMLRARSVRVSAGPVLAIAC